LRPKRLEIGPHNRMVVLIQTIQYNCCGNNNCTAAWYCRPPRSAPGDVVRLYYIGTTLGQRHRSSVVCVFLSVFRRLIICDYLCWLVVSLLPPTLHLMRSHLPDRPSDPYLSIKTFVCCCYYYYYYFYYYCYCYCAVCAL